MTNKGVFAIVVGASPCPFHILFRSLSLPLSICTPPKVAELMRARLRQDWDEAKCLAQKNGGDPDEAVAGMQSGEELFEEIKKG